MRIVYFVSEYDQLILSGVTYGSRHIDGEFWPERIKKPKQRDLETALKHQRKKGLTEGKKKVMKLDFPPDERMKILAECMNRRSNTLWTYQEAERLHAWNPSIEECELIRDFYRLKAKALERDQTNYWKSDLITLINNGQSQLDRARQMVKKRENEAAKREGDGERSEPEGWRDKLLENGFERGKVERLSWEKIEGDYSDLIDKFNLKR